VSAAILVDPRRTAAAHARGENYWYGYVTELADQLGLTAAVVDPHAVVAAPEQLESLHLVLLGDLDDAAAAALAPVLGRWVERGGTLIGFAPPSPLDHLFGVTPTPAPPSPDDAYTVVATLSLADHPLAGGLRPVGHPPSPLLVFSSRLRPVQSAGHVLAMLRAPAADGATAGPPLGAGVVVRPLARGQACFVGFDLAQTLWTLHQGRPITDDHDRDGYYRTGDMIVTGGHRHDVPYADILLLLVQQLAAFSGLPLVHQLPPWRDSVPDALFSWGGDDEAGTDGRQLAASQYFRGLDLPYHINCMAKPPDWRFGLATEQARAILANGHELACHYNFHDGVTHPHRIQREELLTQHAAFVRAFGVPSLTSVNHWTHWSGWTEPAEWLLEAGQLADNSFVHKQSPPINPVNMLAFGFGGAFPFHLYRDHRGGNARLAFVEEPMNAYEPGYLREETDLALIRQVVDTAAHYHLTMNMFYHPGYVHRLASCRLAIAEVPRYCRERGIQAAHMGNDALARWWHARSASRITAVQQVGDGMRCRVRTAWPDGIVVKIPAREGWTTARAGGRALHVRGVEDFGRRWLCILVPSGDSSVEIGGGT